ncbi:MAG: hypothetical protein ACRCTL_12505, partial [Pseudomonas sp.]
LLASTVVGWVEARSAEAQRLACVGLRCAQPNLQLRQRALEPVQRLLRVGHAALKSGSECSFTTRKLRFLAQFRLAWL